MEGTKHHGYTDIYGMSGVHADRRISADPARDALGAKPGAAAGTRPPRIGIVGAGFAGLRSADVLLQNGYEVTILEARNRLGGRVAQSRLGEHLVDLGANWIHGTNDNPILALAKETGTPLHTWDETQAVFDSAGELLASDLADECNELLWDAGLIDQAFRFSNQYHEDIDPQTSLQDFLVYKTESMFSDEQPDVAKRKRKTFLQFASIWGCYIGSPIERQSLKFFWLEECIEGENPFVAGTYERILHKVAEPARSSATIRLNCEVIGIHSGHPVTEASPSVDLANGESLSFDAVVVTTPLGWLKQNRSAFIPELPANLSDAIDHISYGHLDKVYITFPAPFWNSPELGSLEGADDARTRTSIDTRQARQPVQSPAGGSNEHPGFIHWLSPEYAKTTNAREWTQEGMNLAALPGACAHPTLLFYIQGPQSKLIANIVENAESEDERDAELIEWFKPYYSLLSHYKQTDPNCTPVAISATAWANDKFAGFGSYSNFQVGLEKGDEDIEIMRHGMPDRGIWLAGEHTAPFVALGTTTGAYTSGERVAHRILEAYGLSSSPEG